MTDYTSCAATAKLLRKALKESFPGVKFSVRSHTYSMGASIRITWDDGPTSDEVDSICDVFQGADFDGMQDLKTYRRHEMNGQPVSFGADYIFVNRHISDVMRQTVRQSWATLPDIERSKLMQKADGMRGLMPFERPGRYMLDDTLTDFGDNADRVFENFARALSLCPPQPCPTIETIKIV